MAWEQPVLSWSILASRFYSGPSVTNCCFKNKQCRFTRENLFAYINVEFWCAVVLRVSHQIAGFLNTVSLLEHFEWNIALQKHALGQCGFLQQWWFHYFNRKMSRGNKSRPKPMWSLYRLIWYTQHQRGLRLSSPPSDTVFVWKLPP